MEEPMRPQSYFDSASLIQLLQNNDEGSNRKNKRTLKSPLVISVVILYGIVGVLILHLTISSSLRENYLKSVVTTHQSQGFVQTQNYNDNFHPPDDSHNNSKYFKDIKVLQQDVSLLKIQIKTLKIMLASTKIESSRTKNSSSSEVNENLRSTNRTFLNMTWTIPKIMLQIRNFSENLNQRIEVVHKKCNSSIGNLETEIQKIKSQMNLVNHSSITLNETLQTQFKQYAKNTKSPERFLNVSNLMMESKGTDVIKDKIIFDIIKNKAIRELKSCNDYTKLGIFDNGFYEINLMRNTDKFSPARVYCNFTSDTTIIYHDGAEGTNISSCSNSSCFEHKLSYSANDEEIQTLINTSNECEQSIKFRCFHAHLENYGAWYDVHGEKQSYYTGSNYGEHVCSCFKTKTGCSGLAFVNKCNCDASLLPSWLEDFGTITNKTALPISKFTYGHLIGKGQQEAYIQVGPLKCKGNKSYDPKKDCEAFNSPGYKIFEGEGHNEFNITYCNNIHRKTRTSKFSNKIPYTVITYGDVKTEKMGYDGNSLTISVSGYYLTDCYPNNHNDGNNYYGRRTETNSLCDSLSTRKVQYYPKGKIIDISDLNYNKIYTIIMLNN
uniref:Putative LOC588258 [Strongylocentrotus purpuratus] n=1 Tax=Lepeophtheirus salmonis TaxID=72036 RepID=A0A0K2T6N3_LEPSM